MRDLCFIVLASIYGMLGSVLALATNHSLAIVYGTEAFGLSELESHRPRPMQCSQLQEPCTGLYSGMHSHLYRLKHCMCCNIKTLYLYSIITVNKLFENTVTSAYEPNEPSLDPSREWMGEGRHCSFRHIYILYTSIGSVHKHYKI